MSRSPFSPATVTHKTIIIDTVRVHIALSVSITHNKLKSSIINISQTTWIIDLSKMQIRAQEIKDEQQDGYLNSVNTPAPGCVESLCDSLQYFLNFLTSEKRVKCIQGSPGLNSRVDTFETHYLSRLQNRTKWLSLVINYRSDPDYVTKHSRQSSEAFSETKRG